MVRIASTRARDYTVHDWNVFKEHLDTWNVETGYHSNLAIRFDHPSYGHLREHAAFYLPFILLTMTVRPQFLFELLSQVTGITTFELPQQAGNIQTMTDCWVKWGLDEGFLEFEQYEDSEYRARIEAAPIYISEFRE